MPGMGASCCFSADKRGTVAECVCKGNGIFQQASQIVKTSQINAV